jgi:hypothetical protein
MLERVSSTGLRRSVSRSFGNLQKKSGLWRTARVLNEDYRDIILSLEENGVEFLIVGAYAMAAHGYPRATGDIDLWVRASRENSAKVYKALKQFGSPLAAIDEATFSELDIIFQIGVAPRRIDIITGVSGLDFESAYGRREKVEVEGLVMPVISIEDLIVNKESTGRDKDRLDAKTLRSRNCR